MAERIQDQLEGFERYLRVERSLAERTVEGHRDLAERFLNFIGDSDPTKSDVLDFKEYMMAEEYSASHINNAVKAAEHYLSYRGEEVSISKLPRQDKEPNPLTDEQVEDILAAAKTYRDTAIIHTLLSTGLRSQEVADVDVDDVDLEADEIFVQDGKDRKQRTLFFTDKAKAAIDDYLKRRPDVETDALFVSERGERLSRSGVYQLIVRTAERAEIEENVYPHRFRDTYGTRLSRRDANHMVVQDLMRHDDIRSTRSYIRHDVDTLKDYHREYLDTASSETHEDE